MLRSGLGRLARLTKDVGRQRCSPAVDRGVGIEEGRIGRAEDERAQARFGERHLLVDGPQPGALGIEHGIDEVGVGQSFLERLGASRTAKDADDEERNYESSPATQPP